MCVCTDTCKLQHILDCHCCTAFQHMQSGKARATQLYMKQYLQIVHCQELGLAELTGCFGECVHCCELQGYVGCWFTDRESTGSLVSSFVHDARRG